jgi:hypothetical protein
VAALALAMMTSAAAETAPTTSELMAELKRLSARIEKLEQRNAQLESQLKSAAPGSAELEERVTALETYRAGIEAGLADESVSEKEPELTSRLKSVENATFDMQKQAKIIDSLEGFSAGASFVSVGQRASGIGVSGTQLNYRADVTVTTPTIKTGDVESKLFGHFRAGQGKGLAQYFNTFNGPNATAFQLGSVVPPETSAVLLAEAWYQADIPLPFGGFKPHSRETLTVNFGKMDPFAFFDQNAGGNDETRQFLASMFVHNALLDNPLAANVGADGFGFSPGIRVAYKNERTKAEKWGASLGVFAAGEATSYDAPLKSQFLIMQAESQQRLFTGLPGTYRIQLWRNGQAPTFVPGQTASHSGVGLSFDQRVHDAVTLFGRYGFAWGDDLPFDRTISVGTEIGGGYWSRGADALGLAIGANRTSASFRARSATVVDADGAPVYGFTASGYEYDAELYYRFHAHERFEISPDFQYIRNPAGNPGAKSVTIVGLRLLLNY